MNRCGEVRRRTSNRCRQGNGYEKRDRTGNRGGIGRGIVRAGGGANAGGFAEPGGGVPPGVAGLIPIPIYASLRGWGPAMLAEEAGQLSSGLSELAQKATELANAPVAAAGGGDAFLSLFTIFVLACFVGFYVVWSVTPALHSPLMAVTNAISSVIIVGGLLAAGPAEMDFSKVMGFMAVTLASVNIFGGFIVTQRMLGMFKKKKK